MLFSWFLALQLIQTFKVNGSTNVSFNQPKFCSHPLWNSTPTQYPDSTTNVENPYGIFVSRDDTVYVGSTKDCAIHVFSNGNPGSITPLPDVCGSPKSFFATSNGSFYLANDGSDKLLLCSSPRICTPIDSPEGKLCFGLFVSIDPYLYCSVKDESKVIRMPTSGAVSGTNLKLTASGALKNPQGIFVDTNLTLYVADWGNDRIQRFLTGQLNGTTVAGGMINASIDLLQPIAVILDADGFLFILDHGNSRIVIQRHDGWRCLGTQTILNDPTSFAFDSSGSLLVSSKGHKKIFRFQLVSNSCNTEETQQWTTSSMSSSTEQNSYTSTIDIDQPTTITSLQTSESTERSSVVSTDPSSTTISSSLVSSSPTMISRTSLVSSPQTISVASIPLPESFFPSPCETRRSADPLCEMLVSPCSMIEPCEHGGTCEDSPSTKNGFRCSCPEGVDGDFCEEDHRACQLESCWNGGVGRRTSSRVFNCSCPEHWEGRLCQTKINYCQQITCLNGGVCRASIGNWTCECPNADYSGRYCQLTSQRIVIYRAVARSFAYIAILFISLVAIFVVTMDLLKYCFGVDPVGEERKKKTARDFLQRPVRTRKKTTNHRR